MILNKLEFLLMNNPVRAFIQDKVEAKRLRKLSSLPAGKTILEIGCGNGTGTKLIQKYFRPKQIHALDLDPRMIERARRKNKATSITFEVGDAAKLRFPNNHFDAVVDFGIIHHIPNWQDCLKELKRVLKPGGELLLEDLSIDTFNTLPGKFYRKILAHPYEEMYTQEEFIRHLERLRFKVVGQKTYHSLGFLRYFVVIARQGTTAGGKKLQ